MKIVIAPDSFKDSLGAPGVADAIARGLAQVWPDAELVRCPMADGGEGTVESVLAAAGGEWRTTDVEGPRGETVAADWGWIESERTAIIEMATASGLMLLTKEQRDATVTSSIGTGELIRAALDAGAQRVVLGIGGSATNDGGTGVLRALGVRFLDKNGDQLPPGGLALKDLTKVDLTHLDPRLKDVRLEVAADVDNPLCGPRGASHVFGPQKGASPEQVKALDAALAHFADICAPVLGTDHRDFPGCGAAGGIGFAMKAFFEARFRPGIEVVAELTRLDDAMQGADLVITGEGRMDEQTLSGKTPMGVAKVAGRHGAPVIAIVGSLGAGYEKLYDHGIVAAFSLVSGPMDLAEACKNCGALLEASARDIARVWQGASARSS
ncbi:glycerate kinase [Pseudomonas matsuisoli]|uniref:Glycerate kinase n=1 Tax=Pseudomonas matsuisoli TaxID=1515666 RepID=A0A917PVP6_9PSED|nr:glycerate kinase [Pseudomonas matsuisoli]GGJ93753.1 glycerate kinase [Pseudomonas matsuisoli]